MPAELPVNKNIVENAEANKKEDAKELTVIPRPVYKNIEPNFQERGAGLHRDLLADWISVLLSENRRRVQQVEDDSFHLFVNTKSVQFLFTVCLRLRQPHDVKYMALEIYDKFMRAHIHSLYQMVRTKKGLKPEQKLQEWEKIFTTMSRQMALRTVSCIQIASKLHSYNMTITTEKAQTCLKMLGYAYTDESVRKSEIRVLMVIGWCGNLMQTPVTYVETLLDTIFRVNIHLKFKTRSLWEYSLLIMDCVFMHMDEFYQRISMVAYGREGRIAQVPPKQMKRLQADYVLLVSGIIITACICVHGTDFISTIVLTLQQTTGIPAETLSNFYTGIFQTIHDHMIDNPLDTWSTQSSSTFTRNETAFTFGTARGRRKAVTFRNNGFSHR